MSDAGKDGCIVSQTLFELHRICEVLGECVGGVLTEGATPFYYIATFCLESVQ